MKILGAKFKSTSVACSLVLLAASSALAQDSHPTTPHVTAPTASPSATQSKPTTAVAAPNQFTSMDANKDRKISAAEYRNTTLATFLLMDKDRNGKVSAVELTEAQPASSGAASPFSSAQMSEIDTDKDSLITSEEASNAAARMFKNLDINKNQFLSANELNGRQYKSDTEASADSRKSSIKDSHTTASKDTVR